MAVFRYQATRKLRENFMESGIVVAKDSDEAKAKLKQYGFSEFRLARVRRLAALWKRFTADIK